MEVRSPHLLFITAGLTGKPSSINLFVLGNINDRPAVRELADPALLHEQLNSFTKSSLPLLNRFLYNY